MAETCSPRNIGPSNEPLGCGVSERRLGGRRVSFSCFSFHLGVPWIFNRRERRQSEVLVDIFLA